MLWNLRPDGRRENSLWLRQHTLKKFTFPTPDSDVAQQEDALNGAPVDVLCVVLSETCILLHSNPLCCPCCISRHHQLRLSGERQLRGSFRSGNSHIVSVPLMVNVSLFNLQDTVGTPLTLLLSRWWPWWMQTTSFSTSVQTLRAVRQRLVCSQSQTSGEH